MSSFRLSDRHHSILACTGTLRRRHWSINFGRSESQHTLAFDDGSRVAEDIKVTLHAASQLYSARSIRACRNYPAEWSSIRPPIARAGEPCSKAVSRL